MLTKSGPDLSVLARLKDPKYFIERFFWVVNKQKVSVPFIFNTMQQRYYKNRTLWDLVLKSRKEGFSTLIEAINLHACMFFENERSVTMAQNDDETKVHGDRVKHFLKTMGTQEVPWECKVDVENQKEISFPERNSKFWLGTAGAVSFGRSRDITRFHGTEVAHYRDQSVLTGALNACIESAWRVLETTANGVGEMFHRLWRGAVDPQSGSVWKHHFFGWHEDATNRLLIPDGKKLILNGLEQRMKEKFKLDLEQVYWYRQKLAEQPDKSKMPQEYPGDWKEAFLSSGRHAFNAVRLDEMEGRCSDPRWVGEIEDDGHSVRLREDPDGLLKVWKAPRQSNKYLISGDVAEGVPGGAYSVAQVIDRSSWEQVAVWRGHVDPGTFGKVMCDLGYWYNNAILIPENNNHGWATIERIKAEEYPHLFDTHQIWQDTPKKEGFPTNDKTKELVITAERNAIDEMTVFINDITTIRELSTTIRNDKGKVEPQEGCWMDTVMALGIGVYCLKFFTLDETYRDGRDTAAATVSSVSAGDYGSGKKRNRAGYR